MTRALEADCSRCVGLCCVVPAFGRSADFAIDKPARTPCPHLVQGRSCGIHDELPERGFRGCTVYDCFGAGQFVVQELFGGAAPTPAMFDAFEVVERLHELLWYLADARSRPAAATLHSEVDGLRERIEAATRSSADVDVTLLQSRTSALLEEVSALVRRGGPSYRHADLAGRDLRAEDLYAADLRGAVLIGADLRGVDLGPADLLGADLRGARVAGADLSDALFLTRLQRRACQAE